MRTLTPALSLLLLISVAPPAAAQSSRFELGQRLRGFEDGWELAPDADGKKRALRIVEKATNQFLTFQLEEAGRTLDDARHALFSDKPRTAAQQWADTLYAEPETRLFDAAAKELKVKVDAFYSVKAEKPKGLVVRLTLGRQDPVEVKIDKLPATAKLATPGTAGDFPLKLEVLVDGQPARGRFLLVSAIPGAANGFADADKTLDAAKATLDKESIEFATFKDRAELVKSLAGSTTVETNFPAAALWAEALTMANVAEVPEKLKALRVKVLRMKLELMGEVMTVPPDVLKKALAEHPKVKAKQDDLDKVADELKDLRAKLQPTAPRLRIAEADWEKAKKELATATDAAKPAVLAELKEERRKELTDDLKQAEAELKEATAGVAVPMAKPYFTADRAGQFWMTVPTGKTRTPCRVFVPKGLSAKKPVPVVLALHGAGGSENLFFEGYGAGHIVKLCEERGWLLVAPRLTLGLTGSSIPLGEIVDKLAERYPIDPKAVFVVGHSMGAATTVDAVQKYPGKFAAAAALGGGGRVKKDAAGFAALPTFIGVGSADFALAGAKALNKALTDAKAKAVTFKEYAGVEHMVIVREALPDVFALFDKQMKK